MKIRHAPDQYLTYCLNIHPGETWEEHLDAIREKATAVHRKVAPDEAFGLGLRISGEAAAAADDEPARVEELRALLADHELYAFTINGFPYGAFHGKAVKEKVYQPDWRTPVRRRYTTSLADLLARLLPAGVQGSISTVPGSYRPWILRPSDTERMVINLAETARHLAGLQEEHGCLIHLGLEPEPGCFLESTDDVVAFFNEHLLRHGTRTLVRHHGYRDEEAQQLLRTHIGICFDTCHLALQYENLAASVERYRSEGILISKVQLSAALDVTNERARLEALRPFVEPVYLHQVTARTKRGGLRAWSDLPEALRDVREAREFDALRIHFHVPLFWPGSELLGTTSRDLNPQFFAALRAAAVEHLEIETYTFDVLPPALRSGPVEESIAREYAWVLERLD
jgi:sugar phosphate isomerase/epimerase